MKLVCGLGNPGPKYDLARHNAGFMICDRFAERLGARFASRRFSSLMAEGRVGDERILLLKPQTFMNLSGDAVSPAVGFYKLSLEDVLVIHDDADLPLGVMRLKRGGGTAGHKGLESLCERLGAPDFHRLRYGIGRPDNPHLDLADFVLQPLSTAERAELERGFALAVDAIGAWITAGIDAAMNDFNNRTE
jgi:PTH1 family peptidyl-tRNA hydrolase